MYKSLEKVQKSPNLSHVEICSTNVEKKSKKNPKKILDFFWIFIYIYIRCTGRVLLMKIFVFNSMKHGQGPAHVPAISPDIYMDR